MPFTYNHGRFEYDQATLNKMNALMRRVGESNNRALHEAFANVIIRPIQTVVDYEEWTNIFFQEYNVPDLNALPRIAADSPSMVSFYTSPTGEPSFVRPGRTTYSTISLTMIDTALEIGWDDMAMAGWPILEQKIKECGQELARKRDDLGSVVLDAAVATVTDHSTTVTGGSMTKAGVDAILVAAAKAGWKLDFAVLNPATLMDMTGWTFASAQHLWEEFDKTGELWTKGSASNYGGLAWYPRLFCPTNKVYFSASPAVTGAYRWTAGGIRSASDVDIRKRTDLHAWDQKLGHSWLNAYAVWGMTITA